MVVTLFMIRNFSYPMNKIILDTSGISLLFFQAFSHHCHFDTVYGTSKKNYTIHNECLFYVVHILYILCLFCTFDAPALVFRPPRLLSGRACASHAGDRGSIPGRDRPKSFKH